MHHTLVRTSPLQRRPPLLIELALPDVHVPGTTATYRPLVRGAVGGVRWSVTSTVSGFTIHEGLGKLTFTVPYFRYGNVTVSVTDAAGNTGSRTFGISSTLFQYSVDGRQGFLYDVNDLSTVFQDAEATIPAAIGDRVGAILPVTKEHNYRLIRKGGGCLEHPDAILQRDGHGVAYILLNQRPCGSIFQSAATTYPLLGGLDERTYAAAIAFRSLSNDDRVVSDTPLLSSIGPASPADTDGSSVDLFKGSLALGLLPGIGGTNVGVFAPSQLLHIASGHSVPELTAAGRLAVAQLARNSARPQVAAAYHSYRNTDPLKRRVLGHGGRGGTLPRKSIAAEAGGGPSLMDGEHLLIPSEWSTGLTVGCNTFNAGSSIAFYRTAVLTAPVSKQMNPTAVVTFCVTGLTLAPASPPV